jgi:hypothetical protein
MYIYKPFAVSLTIARSDDTPEAALPFIPSGE